MELGQIFISEVAASMTSARMHDSACMLVSQPVS